MSCKCDMKVKLVGDGCAYCNTKLWIDILPTPAELAGDMNVRFSQDQAEAIAAKVYQPLLELITVLNEKITQLESRKD